MYIEIFRICYVIEMLRLTIMLLPAENPLTFHRSLTDIRNKIYFSNKQLPNITEPIEKNGYREASSTITVLCTTSSVI